MNLGQNKFFVGFGTVMLIATGVLGYFLFQASSDSSVADTLYQEQLTKLNSLQSLPLYPEEANLKVLEDQKKLAEEAVVQLHQKLLPMSFPLEPLTPEQFQDKLNASVKKLMEKAEAAGVKITDKNYLGFAQYRSATPKPEAAAALGRQLKSIDFVVDTLIGKKVAVIGNITRVPLPEEPESRSGAAPTPGKQNRAAKPEPALLLKFPFEIQFVATQTAFQASLNDLSKNEKQFVILRPLAIRNTNEKAPKKGESLSKMAVEIATAEKTDSENPAASVKREKRLYALGDEKLNVTLRVTPVIFTSNLPK